MSTEKAEITIAYDPEEKGGFIRCDFAGDDADERDARVQALFETVRETATEELVAKGLQPLAGGEKTDENAVSYHFGTEDDVPMI